MSHDVWTFLITDIEEVYTMIIEKKWIKNGAIHMFHVLWLDASKEIKQIKWGRCWLIQPQTLNLNFDIMISNIKNQKTPSETLAKGYRPSFQLWLCQQKSDRIKKFWTAVWIMHHKLLLARWKMPWIWMGIKFALKDLFTISLTNTY